VPVPGSEEVFVAVGSLEEAAGFCVLEVIWVGPNVKVVFGPETRGSQAASTRLINIKNRKILVKNR